MASILGTRFRYANIYITSLLVASDLNSDIRRTIMNMLGAYFFFGTLLGVVLGGVLTDSTIQELIS